MDICLHRRGVSRQDPFNPVWMGLAKIPTDCYHLSFRDTVDENQAAVKMEWCHKPQARLDELRVLVNECVPFFFTHPQSTFPTRNTTIYIDVFFLGGTLNYNRPRIPTWAHRSMIVTLAGQPDRSRSYSNETYIDLQLTYRNKYFWFFIEKE